MPDDPDVSERLVRLERRVAELEALAHPRLAQPPVLPARGPLAPPPPSAPPARPESPAWSMLSEGAEAWLGQRGLLAIGVLALILAAGYLLKLSFDRGWVSPELRCLAGAASGAAISLLGWRLLPRYRVYGAALVGCGAGICYLAVWAASRLYGFLPPATGIGGLALVSLSLAAIAYVVDVEALAATATFGLLAAPVLLGQERSSANALLLYLGIAAVTLGAVASIKRWRLTTFLLTAGTVWLGFLAEPGAVPVGTLALATLVGTGGLAIGLREHWWETRFASFAGGWALLAAAGQRLAAGERWPLLLAAVALAVPVWLLGLREPRGTGMPLAGGARNWVAGERLYFLLTPPLVTLTLGHVAPAWFGAHDGAAAALVASPYVAAGWITRRGAFTGAGAAMLVLAISQRWSGPDAAAVLLVLTIGWMLAAVGRKWRDASWASAGTFAAAGWHVVESAARGDNEPAFVGHWALSVWGLVVVAALCAYLVSRVRESWGASTASALVPGFAIASAFALFFGVTAELDLLCRQQFASPEGARLAGGLSISAWWILFAAALVVLGFRQRVTRLRVAGLGVAAVAVAKVLFSDLSSLDAFYRIGSVLILGIVSLALAWLYHRQALAKTENA